MAKVCGSCGCVFGRFWWSGRERSSGGVWRGVDSYNLLLIHIKTCCGRYVPPGAILKLTSKADNDFNKLTMNDLKSIAFVYFKGEVLKGDKAQHVKAIEALATAQPAILKAAASPEVAAAPKAAAPVVAMAVAGDELDGDAPRVLAAPLHQEK